MVGSLVFNRLLLMGLSAAVRSSPTGHCRGGGRGACRRSALYLRLRTPALGCWALRQRAPPCPSPTSAGASAGPRLTSTLGVSECGVRVPEEMQKDGAGCRPPLFREKQHTLSSDVPGKRLPREPQILWGDVC